MDFDLEFSRRELRERRERIEAFIGEMVSVTDSDGAVIGLSGGIDSTTVAYLAVEELGADAVRGFVLPSEVNRTENMTDAEAVAEELGIEYETISIEPIVDAFLETFPGVDDPDLSGKVFTDPVEGARGVDPLHWAVACLRLRVRAIMIYFFADRDNQLVLGAGHRTETLVGYYLPNGDQAVDCEPMGNLYKTQVRQLARDLGVPERIVEKPATGGLYEGQTDEEELGLSYAKLDAVLALAIDGNVPTPTVADILDGVTEGDVEHVRDLHRESEPLRQMSPVPAEEP